MEQLLLNYINTVCMHSSRTTNQYSLGHSQPLSQSVATRSLFANDLTTTIFVKVLVKDDEELTAVLNNTEY